MSTLPEYPTEITIDTLPQLFAAHRARFGAMQMNGGQSGDNPPTDPPGDQNPPNGGGAEPPARPDGISEAEWDSLGDPGKTAITREREARQAAERALAASRARPTPPKKTAEPKPSDQPKGSDVGSEPDIAKIVQNAVAAAIKPFQEREEQRDAEAAARRVTDAVMKAAGASFLDPTDALAINLAAVVDENGDADPAKVSVELEDLLKRKPHLAKSPDGRRYTPPGTAAGATGPAAAPLNERVQSVLAEMQAKVGIKPSN